MKILNVVAAIIIDSHDHPKKVFATEKGYGPFKGKWEFPGGKIEQGENPKEALKREIEEELGVEIDILELLDIIDYDYPDFHLNMKCYLSMISKGEICLKEASSSRWLKKENLMTVDWLPADIPLVEKIYDII